MTRTGICLFTLVVGMLGSSGLTGYAAAPPAKGAVHPNDWGDHDTAVYVVSTLNLLYTTDGRPVPAVLIQRGIARYWVFQDMEDRSLYFIQLRRQNASIGGVLAYRMGWLKPQSLTRWITRLGVAPASSELRTAYHEDSKRLLASLRSTRPR